MEPSIIVFDNENKIAFVVSVPTPIDDSLPQTITENVAKAANIPTSSIEWRIVNNVVLVDVNDL